MNIFDQARNVLKTLKQGKANPILQGIYDLPGSTKILAQRAPQAVNQLVMDPRVAGNFARNAPKTASIKVPGMQSVANFSANTAQSFGQGLQDMAMGYNKVSTKPGAFNKLQGSAQMIAGAGKTVAPFTLPFQVANAVTSAPQINNMFLNPVQRFSAGVLRGMSGDQKLAENIKNKNDINLNLFGTKIGIDPAETAGQMIGFVKNPVNKQLFKLTNSVFPTGSLAAKGTNLKKWLAVTGLRGGVENILLDLAKVPENATNEQKIAFMLKTAGIGSVTELGGRGMLDVSGAVGNKVLNNKQIVQAFNELKFTFNKLNIPVATTNIDPSTGKRVTMPMWKYRLDKMGINEKGFIKPDEFLPKPKTDVANAGLSNKQFDQLGREFNLPKQEQDVLDAVFAEKSNYKSSKQEVMNRLKSQGSGGTNTYEDAADRLGLNEEYRRIVGKVKALADKIEPTNSTMLPKGDVANAGLYDTGAVSQAKSILQNNTFKESEIKGYLGLDPKYEPQGIPRDVWKQAAKELGITEASIKEGTPGNFHLESRVVNQSFYDMVAQRMGARTEITSRGDDLIGDTFNITKNGNTLRVSVKETPDTIMLGNIQADVKGTGLGTDFVNQLKAHADETGKILKVEGVSDKAHPYWQKFGWLEGKGKGYEYNPRVAQESVNQSFYDTKKLYSGSDSSKGSRYFSESKEYAGVHGKNISEIELPKNEIFDTRNPQHKQIFDTLGIQREIDRRTGLPISTGDAKELENALKKAGYNFKAVALSENTGMGGIDEVSYFVNNQSRVAQESISDAKPPFSMGFAGENQVAPLRNTGMGGYTNVRSLDNPLLNNKVSEINPTLQKSTSAINLEPQGIKQQSQRLPNTEAIRSTMNQPKSSPYNTQEYIKELTEKQQQAGGSDGPTGLKQKASNFLAEVKAKLVDETAPLTDILTASEKQNKFKVLPKQDIRLQIDRALRSKNLASQFAEDNGLVDAIKKAPDLNALDQYMIAKHAANVEKQGIKTGRDLARDQQLIQDLAPQYEAIAQQVNQYSRKLLDYAVKSGLIDEKLAKGLVEKYPEYVPLNRIFSELEQPNFRGTGKGVASLSRQTVVQKLQGSEREIRSPIESLLLKTQDAFSQGERNIAAKQLASYKSLPGFEGLIKEVDAGSRAPHSFSFIDNGVKKTYATTREIEAAAKALNVEQMGILGKIISTPTRMLQLGATGLNIPFVVTNVVKDEVTGFVNSNRAAKTSILNPANYVKALFSAVKHDELYKDLVRNAGGGTSFDIARDAPNLSIAKIRSPKMYTVRHPLELLRTIENLVGRGEELGRIKNFEGTRQALLKEGRTLQDANLLGGQAARENTANFARRGSFGRVINWMIPFFNAGIQGSRQMVRSFQNAPAQTSTKVAATIFTPIAVATVWNLSDPQRKQIYADIPQHEKENNIILIPPDVTQDERGRYNVIKIPLPPGLSNLGTIVRRALETTQGLDAIKFGEIATNLITAGTSVDVTSGNKLASTFTPQLAKPLVESTTNTNLFTGQRIIPDYMKNRPAELQTRPGVTPIATGIGKLLNVSPLMVENFAQTQLGGLGSQLLGKESPIGNLERRFKKASGGELLDRVYEDSTKIQAINSQAKSLLEAGKKEEALKLIQSNKDLLMKTSKVKTIRSEVDTLQEYKNKVKADTRLTQEQKNKVLTLIQQKLNELSNVYNSVNQL